MTPEGIVMRTGSHRARERLTRLVGAGPLPDYYYWLDKGFGTVHVQIIPAEYVEEACKIPGVGRAHRHGELHRSW